MWNVECGLQIAQCRGKFKGPPSAPELTFGSVGRMQRCATQHDNGARPKFHTVSSVKRAKLWGSNVKRKV